MGPESALTEFKSTDSELLDNINRQIGSDGLHDFEEFGRLGRVQPVEFVNASILHQLRDFVFFTALHTGGGIYPLALEHFMRSFASGKFVHTVDFAPAVPSADPGNPVPMAGACLSVSYPTPIVEWMDKPIYGGLAKETMHIVNLLTPEPTRVSHPDLPLVDEGRITHCGQRLYLRRFAGVSPKDGIGPNNASSES